ncbi:MAG TPA: hypothetical protein VK907_11090 [Phnomibacter sp.]|nr:hypothetical protein [Phnomibacter sp.]
MEPGVRLFLITIVRSMSFVLLWMLLNTYFGIKLGLMFFDEGVTAWHIVYYICMVGSFIYVVRVIMREWKKVPALDKFDEEG